MHRSLHNTSQRLGRTRPVMGRMYGGKQGRPMLMHNGYGIHGGMNAKGSGRGYSTQLARNPFQQSVVGWGQKPQPGQVQQQGMNLWRWF